MAEGTPFQEVYDLFLSSITDDMFMELTEEETNQLLEEILLRSLPMFELPRVNLFDLDREKACFNERLSFEEENIVSKYMICSWMDFQIASVENVRQKYSGSDFKFTSQAAHIDKLLALKKEFKEEGLHLQRLYGRRRLSKDLKSRSGYVSDFERIMGTRTW